MASTRLRVLAPEEAPRFWRPSIQYAAGDIRTSPTGIAMSRTANGTSRAAYDATEAALWAPIVATPGQLAPKLDKTEAAATYTRQSILPLNARAFGAVGNGSADDTAALQAWMDAGLAARRALYLPQGRYKITATLTIAITDSANWVGGVKIYGDGGGISRAGGYPGSVIEPSNAVTGPALQITGTSTTTNSNAGQINGLIIEDIGIRGVEGGSNGDGIELKYWTNAVLRNLLIQSCANGIRLRRQDNSTTFGYGNGTLVENCHLVINREFGLHAADAGAMCGITVQGSNFGANTGGGIKIAPGPATLHGNLYTGNVGPGLYIVAPTGASNATGPTVIGDHFETNGTPATGDYSVDLAQVIIDFAQGPRFIGCNFLGSGGGENSVKAGHAGVVNGLTMIGNTHFGKTSVNKQAVIAAGPNLVRTNFQDTEIFGFGGSSARATSAQIHKSTDTDSWTYSHLGQGVIAQGAVNAPTGVAIVAIENSMLPLGCRATIEFSSQGGSVYAYGLVKRGRDGASVSVVSLSNSTDCVLSIVSGSVRVTQTNTSSLILNWSMHITQTV